jgi:hypothetical protein
VNAPAVFICPQKEREKDRMRPPGELNVDISWGILSSEMNASTAERTQNYENTGHSPEYGFKSFL